MWLDRVFVEAGCGTLISAKKSCVATLSLTDKSGSSIAPVNYVYPDALKNVEIPVANVTVRIHCAISAIEKYIPNLFFANKIFLFV